MNYAFEQNYLTEYKKTFMDRLAVTLHTLTGIEMGVLTFWCFMP